MNVLIDVINQGYAGFKVSGVTDAASAVALVSGDWNGSKYLQIKSAAWTKLLTYYANSAK